MLTVKVNAVLVELVEVCSEQLLAYTKCSRDIWDCDNIEFGKAAHWQDG